MRRREFVTLVGGAAAWPVAAWGQPADRVFRVGVLGADFEADHNPISAQGYEILLTELRKLGFTEGHNLIVERRRLDEGMAKAFAGANELVAAKADVLLVSGAEVGIQAAAATRPQRPIVLLANNFDPLARGYVASLSRPGGNITGLFYRQPELAAKQLEILTEAFPDKKRVVVLWDIDSTDQFAAAEQAARNIGLSVISLKLENPPYDWDAAFRDIAQKQPDMLLVLSSARFAPYRKRIAELANHQRLPAMYIFKYYVQAGGLLSYGVDTNPLWRRAASYVAKILRGAAPGDLPVEQVANFELALNLKTTKSIGLPIPTSILLRADEVIE